MDGLSSSDSDKDSTNSCELELEEIGEAPG